LPFTTCYDTLVITRKAYIMDISIVIPVYNEEANISPLSAEIKDVMTRYGRTYELIFINDGSTDNTFEELKKAKSSHPNVKIIDLNRNFGQTPAIMAGFHYAKGNIIVTMDGDLQNDPHDIPKMVEKIESGFDLVSGWRRKRKDAVLTRVIPSKLANGIISGTLKVPLHDYGCTLKAYKHNIVKDMPLYGEMHRFIPAIASWKGAKMAEIEVNHRPRKHGKTKYGLNRTLKVLMDLLLLAFLSEYSTKPIRFFGALGFLSGLLGVISVIGLLYMKIFEHMNMVRNPLLILSALFFIVSVQFISMGFLGEINIRTYYESQNKKTYHIHETIE